MQPLRCPQPPKRRHCLRLRAGATRRPPARGSVVLELLLVLPVWLVVLLGMFLFGQLIIHLQQVSLASRVGALEASQTFSPPTSAASLALVVDAVEQQMATAGMTPCKIYLQHNVGGTFTTLEAGDCDNCPPPTDPLPFVHLDDDGFPDLVPESVRVTVCVPATELTPNALKFCGLDISQWIIRQSTTLRYELTPP